MPIFIFVGGYCIHKIIKKQCCTSCLKIHIYDKNLDLHVHYNFVKNLDRGQLKFPKEHIVNVVLYNYVIINKLFSKFQAEFLKIQDHRKIVMSITTSILDENDLLRYGEVCEILHNTKDVLMKIFWTSTNILLNNF